MEREERRLVCGQRCRVKRKMILPVRPREQQGRTIYTSLSYSFFVPTRSALLQKHARCPKDDFQNFIYTRAAFARSASREVGVLDRLPPFRRDFGCLWRGSFPPPQPPREKKKRKKREETRTDLPEVKNKNATTRLDDVHGLNDARGAHAREAAVHERLDGLPGGVISERHGVYRGGVRSVGGRCVCGKSEDVAGARSLEGG